MALKVVPTKGNLIAMKKSLQLANLGYNLMDQKRNVLIKEMMTLLDDVKIIRDQITSSYQEAYDALQEANISMGLISSIVKIMEYRLHIVVLWELRFQRFLIINSH